MVSATVLILFLPSESRSIYPHPYNRQYRMIFHAGLPGGVSLLGQAFHSVGAQRLSSR
jgi:hypothetical protein